MSKPVDFDAARKAQKDREYRSLVLKAFDDIEHTEKRELRERKSEVERAARNRL